MKEKDVWSKTGNFIEIFFMIDFFRYFLGQANADRSQSAGDGRTTGRTIAPWWR